MTERLPARRIRVLVADDSPQVQAAVTALVSSRRGMVLAGVAGDAASVLAALAVARPDVVLLDVRMPGDGATVAREISARWPGVAVVALTAHDDPSTAAEMRSAGAVAFLVKGVSTVAEIEAAIRLAADGPADAASAI